MEQESDLMMKQEENDILEKSEEDVKNVKNEDVLGEESMRHKEIFEEENMRSEEVSEEKSMEYKDTSEEESMRFRDVTEEENMKYKEVSEEESMRFKDADIDERVLRAVEELDFETMTPIQEQAIPVLLQGKDIIGQAQTGTGKTAAFGIPMIQSVDASLKKLQAIVLCPTRELAMQAAEEIRKLAKYMHGIKVLPVYGGQDISRQIRALSQGVQIVVGTPGRVMDHMRRHTIKTADVKMIVLDEADEMLDMGFREDIETILADMPKERQMALFSATMPEPILKITHEYQKDAEYIRVTPEEITVAAIKQAYYRIARKDKMDALCRLLDYYQPVRSLIFCNTKKMVDEMAEILKDRGYQAEGLHGDLSQHQRDTVMNAFRTGRCAILIATDVAARGIDVSGVDAVFNYDVPEDIEYYVHRIGRTGRAGKTGRSFTLVCGREIYKIRDIERLCHTQIQERRLPDVKDIIRVKSGKVFAEAMEIMNQKDLNSIKASIEKAAEEHGFDVLDLAAAFMQMKVGDEPREIQEERSLFGRKGTSERGREERGRRGRGRERDRGRDKERDRERNRDSFFGRARKNRSAREEEREWEEASKRRRKEDVESGSLREERKRRVKEEEREWEEAPKRRRKEDAESGSLREERKRRAREEEHEWEEAPKRRVKEDTESRKWDGWEDFESEGLGRENRSDRKNDRKSDRRNDMEQDKKRLGRRDEREQDKKRLGRRDEREQDRKRPDRRDDMEQEKKRLGRREERERDKKRLGRRDERERDKKRAGRRDEREQRGRKEQSSREQRGKKGRREESRGKNERESKVRRLRKDIPLGKL